MCISEKQVIKPTGVGTKIKMVENKPKRKKRLKFSVVHVIGLFKVFVYYVILFNQLTLLIQTNCKTEMSLEFGWGHFTDCRYDHLFHDTKRVCGGLFWTRTY